MRRCHRLQVLTGEQLVLSESVLLRDGQNLRNVAQRIGCNLLELQRSLLQQPQRVVLMRLVVDEQIAILLVFVPRRIRMQIG